MSTSVPPDRISRAVRAYFLAIRAMDADAFANAFAEDGTTLDPVGSPAITGREALREFFQSICSNFNVSLDEDSVFVAGNGAAVKLSAKRKKSWLLAPKYLAKKHARLRRGAGETPALPAIGGSVPAT